MPTTLKVVVTELSDSDAADILCTALEGGIGYWSQCAPLRSPSVGEDWVYKSAWLYPTESPDFESDTGVCPGVKRNDEGAVLLDYAAILRGINLILEGSMVNNYTYEMVLRNFTQDDPMDADGADCVVQAGLFGQIVYA